MQLLMDFPATDAAWNAAFDADAENRANAGLTLLQIDSVQKPAATTVTPTSSSGAAYAYTIDRVDAGGTVVVVYRAQVAGEVAVDHRQACLAQLVVARLEVARAHGGGGGRPRWTTRG